MNNNESRCLQTTDEEAVQRWLTEGEAVIADIKPFVNRVEISTKLPAGKENVYFNLETKELKKYCIEMSAAGFRICSNNYDSAGESSDYFETIYSLLNSVSMLYRKSFGETLIDKLKRLENAE